MSTIWPRKRHRAQRTLAAQGRRGAEHTPNGPTRLTASRPKYNAIERDRQHGPGLTLPGFSIVRSTAELLTQAMLRAVHDPSRRRRARHVALAVYLSAEAALRTRDGSP